MHFYNHQILEVDAAETRRYAGLRKAKNFGEKNILDACEEALLLIDVRAAWNVYDYKNFFVESEPPVLIVGNSIRKHLDGCEKVICMAVTVGFEIEREINKKFERGEYLSSVLLDAAATAAVEQAADALENHLAEIFAKDGFKLRWRFSPGYGDWDLTAQEKLFKISGAEKIGISLTSAMMLEPRKSVTAIIGAIRNEELGIRNEACATCDKLDCMMRK
ncbi:MAG: methionine synthase [Selenomonadaceae bacterium]|nr:methionine synthase [Selenomonadaceae bacterium]